VRAWSGSACANARRRPNERFADAALRRREKYGRRRGPRSGNLGGAHRDRMGRRPARRRQSMARPSTRPARIVTRSTRNDVGPRHRGVFGRKAASLSDYDYSDALKSANIVWNEETLDKWLTDPQAVAPAPRCSFTWTIRGSCRRDCLSQGARQIRCGPAGPAA